MSRLPVHLRTAVPADAAELVPLWAEFVDGQPARLAPPTVAEAERAIARIGVDPRRSLQVAVFVDAIVGVAHLHRTPVSPLHDEDAVHVTHLFVTPALRRRGVGRALLTAAVTWGEESGAGHLMTAVAAGSREANRFLACLGLSQTAMVRSVPVAVLRQRLTVSDAEASDTPALQARRRTLLRRQISARGAAASARPVPTRR